MIFTCIKEEKNASPNQLTFTHFSSIISANAKKAVHQQACLNYLLEKKE